ncbi:unnamed protein product [Rhizoctonia solani]|uniref:Uncharacterized protein n=1 Tax=Rhizoctonia solani TaxID=456999 RepID=A0A8H2Y056_9AGAM|nr:unnamed protein product [Rhizoctonia solani]
MYNLLLNGSQASQLSCYHYSLDRLYSQMVQSHGTEDSPASIVVKSASYCKRETLPNHEFIWIMFENTKLPNAWNYMVLDRNKFEHGSGLDSVILSSIQHAASIVAQDEFRISCDGNINNLLKRCKLVPCRTLETISFDTGNVLPLYRLAAVAVAASDLRRDYHFVQANCYWFAGMVWEYLIRHCPDIRHVVRENVRGKFGTLFSHTTDENELDDVVVIVQELLSNSKFHSTEQGQAHTMENSGFNETAAIAPEILSNNTKQRQVETVSLKDIPIDRTQPYAYAAPAVW